MTNNMLIGIIVLCGFVLAIIGVVVTIIMAIRERKRHEWQFGIGSVIGKTAELFTRIPLILVGVALACGILVTGAIVVLTGSIVGFGQAVENPSLWAAFAAYWLVALAIGAFLRTIGLRAAIDVLFGGEASIVNSMLAAVRLFPRILGLSLLIAVASWLGCLLLIVPGIVIACAWLCATATVVAEDRSITEALTRSAELTRGARWRILLLFIIGMVALGLLQIFAGLLAGLFARLFGDVHFYIGQVLTTAISNAVVTAAIAASYHELRTNKEGAGVAELEAVFA